MSIQERRERFEFLARELIEPVRRYLLRRTDPDTAEDVLADTLLVLWRRVEEIPDGPESLEEAGDVGGAATAWAYGVARNCLANAERGSRRRRRLSAKILAVDPPREMNKTEVDHSELMQALESLPDQQAEVLRLWAWEELGPSEIATALGISPNAASIRLHRAKGSLREQIASPRKISDSAGHEHTEDRRPPR